MLATRRISQARFRDHRCLSCSAAMLSAFASGCGAPIRLSVPVVARRNLLFSQQKAGFITRRGIHSSLIRFNDAEKVPTSEKLEDGEGKEVNVEDEVEALREKAEESTTKEEEQVPWFLRVETPKPPSHPFAANQILPPFPENPPAALEPVLKRLSEELGILDLKILDIRPLDPPPAIGAETIMILGNARSERHLHVSADKICRWLRSEYKWAPYADGLVGRNELKLKNRRKRRRGKLGTTEVGGEEDEESRVGWVCVNVGKQGLIIQLFTPEKREEINLEELWEGALVRNERRKERERVRMKELEDKIAAGKAGEKRIEGAIVAERVADDMVAEEVVTVVEAAEAIVTEDISKYETTGEPQGNIYPSTPTPYKPSQNVFQTSHFSKPQTRTCHTSARRLHPNTRITSPDPEAAWYTNTPFKLEGLHRAIAKGQIPHLMLDHVPPSWTPNTDPQSPSTNLLLRAHLNHFKKREVGEKEIGNGPDDKTSTAFLKNFWSLMPEKPSPEQLKLGLEFYIHANKIPESGYKMEHVIAHFKTMVDSGMTINPEIYYLLLKAIAETPDFRLKGMTEGGDIRLTKMGEVLTHMRANYPYPSFTPEIAYCFLRALISTTAAPRIQYIATKLCSEKLFRRGTAMDEVLMSPSPIVAKFGHYLLDHRVVGLNDMVKSSGFNYEVMEYNKLLIVSYSMASHWTAVWSQWKHVNYVQIRRDEEMYSLFVGLLVLGDNQREASKGVKHLWDDMKQEIPPVELTPGLARGFWRLISIAERGETSAEFVEVKRKCLEVILEGEAKYGVRLPELEAVMEMTDDKVLEEEAKYGVKLPELEEVRETTENKAAEEGGKRMGKEPAWLGDFEEVLDAQDMEADAVDRSLGRVR
ncbi:ATPase synthesis protein 25, mitochondrial [Rhizina undulata]